MTWQEVLKSASKYESAVAEEFVPEEMEKKDNSPLLQKLNKKQKKKIKKLLQAAQPSEYLGQEYTKAGDLISELRALGLMKSKGEKELLEKLESSNVDIIAASAELRKDYENMYRRIRGLVYPKRREVFSEAGTNAGESNREMDDYDREASREQRG
jgi:Txe/YoeB family toxin of Txe-Axe toxin-antitoxin module